MKEHLLPGVSQAGAEKELSRRALLALVVGATSHLALSAISIDQSIAQKVMGLGRGLHTITHDDGRTSYEPTAETMRRADEMGRYHQAYLGRVTMLLCSGGFQEVASGGKVTRPPEDESEAAKQAERLETEWDQLLNNR